MVCAMDLDIVQKFYHTCARAEFNQFSHQQISYYQVRAHAYKPLHVSFSSQYGTKFLQDSRRAVLPRPIIPSARPMC
jgi:hypothetical protein